MSEVLCWYCEYFLVNGEDGTRNGTCLKIPMMLSPYNEVCEEFIMKKGLHTKRTIPEFCKNYNKSK